MKFLRSYLFWTYERGSIHYDIIVTLILLFLFVSPHFINFKDNPVTVLPLKHSEVLVKEQQGSGSGSRFVYEVRVDDLHGADTDTEIKAAILNVIEPIAGDVTVQKYTPVRDPKGHIVAYDATVIH